MKHFCNHFLNKLVKIRPRCWDIYNILIILLFNFNKFTNFDFFSSAQFSLLPCPSGLPVWRLFHKPRCTVEECKEEDCLNNCDIGTSASCNARRVLHTFKYFARHPPPASRTHRWRRCMSFAGRLTNFGAFFGDWLWVWVWVWWIWGPSAGNVSLQRATCNLHWCRAISIDDTNDGNCRL